MFLLLWCLVLLCNSVHATAGHANTIDVHSSIKCVDYERVALLHFKRGIKHDHCGLLSSWGGQEDCCQWRGIRCSNLTGHVTVLHLRGFEFHPCLVGKVDSSLFNLHQLNYLDLSWNRFGQTIPKTIVSLANLKHLNLSNAGFFGDIPVELGNLSKLEYLDMNGRYSEINVVTSLQWLSHLKLLKYIDLSYTNLSKITDWVQIVNSLPSLRVLHMNSCQLPPKFTSPFLHVNSSSSLRVVSISYNHLYDNLVFQWLFNLSANGSELEYLDLAGNSLSEPIPSSFGKFMHNLSHLSLSDNLLEGRIPDSFSKLRSLRVLSLSHNKFHGLFPRFISNFCNLQELNLSHNNFVDDMSSVIQTLSNMACGNKPLLESLDLSENQLWGSIPDMISSFSLLREVYLNGNHLNGTISEGIGQLTRLIKLGISNNSLEVTLSHSHFLNLSRLNELDLSDNTAVVIKFDTYWIPPFQLNKIYMRSCALGPHFPNWLLTQANFSYLDISNAQISGNIPTVFWTESLSSNMQYLNLSHNMIHGVLPNLSTIIGITAIDLSSNHFEGPIHSLLGVYASQLYAKNDSTRILCPRTQRWPFIHYLDLSNNKLSGELPDCWMQFDRLSSLHLESNKFSGRIPASFGALTQLKYLNLRNNGFSGELPVTLMNCTSLVILDVGYNSLVGYIPSSLGYAVKGLRILNLRRNKFLGNLPSSLCQLSQLQILDLALNKISGAIPKCINNLNAMMMTTNGPIPASKNFLEYETANDITLDSEVIEWKRKEQRFGSTLKLVKAIDLSSNVLQWDIPFEAFTLDGLISLNLSRNRLTGSIASNIGHLTSIEALDLSNNHLIGEIPRSLSDLSNLEVLDMSNNNLSGKIPFGTQLSTFDNPSFEGNPLLCVGDYCARDEPGSKGTNGEKNNSTHQLVVMHHKNNIYARFYICMVVGFIIGFWAICGTLIIKRSWRNASFQLFDGIKDKPYFMVIVNLMRACITVE